jgi:uncharacterized protein involved in exopolysaccharide biosynthesis
MDRIMKNQDLLQKKIELEKEIMRTQMELNKVVEKLNVHKLEDELEELHNITDQLNSLFQNSLVEKHGEPSHWSERNASDLIHEAMQILDKASTELEEEIKSIEIENC